MAHHNLLIMGGIGMVHGYGGRLVFMVEGMAYQ